MLGVQRKASIGPDHSSVVISRTPAAVRNSRLPNPGHPLSYVPLDLTNPFNLSKGTGSYAVGLNYQFVINPAYNRDRGPASIFGVRMRAQF